MHEGSLVEPGVSTAATQLTTRPHRMRSVRADRDQLDDDVLFGITDTGDGAAIEELIHRYRRRVGMKLRGHFLPGAERDDLRQEAMIGLLQAIRAYRPGEGVPFSA